MLMLLSSVALAGWTQPEGGHYAQVGVRGIVGDRVMPATGVTLFSLDEEIEVEAIQDWAVQAYAEYGITDDWTAVLQTTPIGYSRYADNGTVYTGIYKLGIRHGLMTGTHNLAIQADLGYTPPLGEIDLSEGSLEPEFVFVPTVSTIEAGGQLHYGAGFGQNWLSLSAGGAWLSRLDPILTGQLQLGRVGKKRGNRVDLHIPIRHPLVPLSEPLNAAGTGNTRYVGIGVGYTFTFGEGWGVGTSAEAILAAGANIGAPTYPLSVEHSSAP